MKSMFIYHIFNERVFSNADWLWAIKLIATRTRKKSVQIEFLGLKNQGKSKHFDKF